MALPAVKGVIIVGGVAVALGVALYEHEPFRAWARDRWRDTNEAFEDLLNDLNPQRRRAHRFGDGASPPPNADRSRRDFPWNFRPGRSGETRQPEQAAAASGRQADLQPAGAIKRRKGSGGEFGIPLDEMSARAVHDEAILDQAGPDSSRQSLDGDGATPSTLADDPHKIPESIPHVVQRSRQTSDAADEDRAMLTPSTSTGDLSELDTEDGSLQIVHTPTSTRLGSEVDPFDDDDDDDNESARSHTTETMSQVSALSGDGDDRMSMASSWSQVSEAAAADVQPREVA